MAQLLNSEQLRVKHNLSKIRLDSILAKHKIQPVHEMNFGRGIMRMYDAAEAGAVIEKEESKRKPKALPPPPAPVVAAPSVDLTALSKRLDEFDKTLEALTERVDKISQQNMLLLRAMDKYHEDIVSRFDTARKTVVEVLEKAASSNQNVPTTVTIDQIPTESVVVVTPAPAPEPEPPKPKPKLKSVTVVGLIAHQKQLIEKEFRDCFDLSFYESDEAKGRAFTSHIGKTDAVFAMTNFINHSVEDAIKNTSTQLVRVSGGMSTLRNKLTDYYVKVTT